MAYQSKTYSLSDEVVEAIEAKKAAGISLVSAHAFFGFAQQVNRGEPFHQGQVGIVKDCSGGCAKLVLA